VIAIEMHFLPNVYVTCEQCKGRRYNRETLDIKYRGKSIADVLDLTVDQALPILENFPPIANKLRTLQNVGLGYIELGQSATTLSGGEAQRVKLSRELSKRGTGRTLYILDEPTTGLHFEDVRKLLDVLNRLVDQGNTIVVIEHNLDVIKSADWVIDLGPEGGEAGGRVVAQGTPEQISSTRGSHTGHFLAELFAGK
jgi:excinuclease ABC subunit A